MVCSHPIYVLTFNYFFDIIEHRKYRILNTSVLIEIINLVNLVIQEKMV